MSSSLPSCLPRARAALPYSATRSVGIFPAVSKPSELSVATLCDDHAERPRLMLRTCSCLARLPAASITAMSWPLRITCKFSKDGQRGCTWSRSRVALPSSSSPPLSSSRALLPSVTVKTLVTSWAAWSLTTLPWMYQSQLRDQDGVAGARPLAEMPLWSCAGCFPKILRLVGPESASQAPPSSRSGSCTGRFP